MENPLSFGKIKSFFRKIGPGFVTGAADNDPSGLATYSLAGSQFGYKLNFLSLFLLPSMISIQEMCGRLGLVSGRGLAGIIKKYYPKIWLFSAVGLLALANIINIGADLGIVAASLEMLFGGHFFFWLIAATLFIVWLEIKITYGKYVRYLKFMGLSLGVYIVTAFLAKQDWRLVLRSLLVPNIELNRGYLMMMIGFIGTTISPYLFFWQTSEEVEEEIKEGKIRNFAQRPKVFWRQIKALSFDTKIGMIFSNLITFFVVLTTAATLHRNGIFNIDSPQQAALGLQPLAGDFAYFLFALGIIGIGLQSIPVLAGSLAYAFSEALGVPEGLSKSFKEAKGFYLIIIISTSLGAVINLLGINTIKALYYAAIINGIVAIPLIGMILKLANTKEIVGKFKTPKIYLLIGRTTFLFMIAAVFLMFLDFFGVVG